MGSYARNQRARKARSEDFAEDWGGHWLSERELEELELLARLHDIGKVTVPREILNKEGPLTPEEWKIVRRHVEAGYRIAQLRTNWSL